MTKISYLNRPVQHTCVSVSTFIHYQEILRILNFAIYVNPKIAKLRVTIEYKININSHLRALMYVQCYQPAQFQILRFMFQMKAQ